MENVLICELCFPFEICLNHSIEGSSEFSIAMVKRTGLEKSAKRNRISPSSSSLLAQQVHVSPTLSTFVVVTKNAYFIENFFWQISYLCTQNSEKRKRKKTLHHSAPYDSTMKKILQKFFTLSLVYHRKFLHSLFIYNFNQCSHHVLSLLLLLSSTAFYS